MAANKGDGDDDAENFAAGFVSNTEMLAATLGAKDVDPDDPHLQVFKRFVDMMREVGVVTKEAATPLDNDKSGNMLKIMFLLYLQKTKQIIAANRELAHRLVHATDEDLAKDVDIYVNLVLGDFCDVDTDVNGNATRTRIVARLDTDRPKKLRFLRYFVWFFTCALGLMEPTS